MSYPWIVPDYDPEEVWDILGPVVSGTLDLPQRARMLTDNGKVRRRNGPPPHHRDAPPRVCSKCNRVYRERWIYRRRGKLMCAACCEHDSLDDWVSILPGAAYTAAA